jgi:hypothetical protein
MDEISGSEIRQLSGLNKSRMNEAEDMIEFMDSGAYDTNN